MDNKTEMTIVESLNKEIDKMKFDYMRDAKIKFLKTVNENSPYKTVKLYISVLLKIDNAEYINKREWYNFSEEMVDSAIVDLKSKSEATLQSYLTIIKDYLVTTTPESDVQLTGYIYTLQLSKNDLLDLDEQGREKPEHMKKYYLNKIGQTMQYITEEELDDIVLNHKGDASTKAMAILLFNGVRGENYIDLVNIRREDVDLTSGELTDEFGKVLYTMPEKYSKIFKTALKDEKYIEYDYEGNKVVTKMFALDSPYFLRRTIFRVSNGLDPIDSNICNRRIKALGKGAMNPHITPVSIYNSGMTMRLIEECGYREPTWRQTEDFRKEHNVKIAQTSVKTITKILLDKITSPSV